MQAVQLIKAKLNGEALAIVDGELFSIDAKTSAHRELDIPEAIELFGLHQVVRIATLVDRGHKLNN
jgi:hypothetical protein